MALKNEEQYEPLRFDKIRIGLASPEKIRAWSKGEVTEGETINYRSLKPEPNGLFCEKIFGPQKDYECRCGKYKKIRYKGITCDKCGVEVTKAAVRRERMGHIELGTPVSHIWYFKGTPSRMALCLGTDFTVKDLEKVLYYSSCVVLDAKDKSLYKKVMTLKEYEDYCADYGRDSIRVGKGAEAILELLKAIDLDAEIAELKEQLAGSVPAQKKVKLLKRLDVLEAFKKSGNKPEWMVLTCIPVLPPDLRPLMQLDGGRFATTDINDLYRRILGRNKRLAELREKHAPEVILTNEKRMLQDSVDALIDNGRHSRAVTGAGGRPLKSLSDSLKGKTGRFRMNLLGKRVDYSGRSVIVVGPELKIYQCGLPKDMAVELFKPFVMKELVARGKANNIKQAKKKVERLEQDVYDVIEDVITEHPVLLNRAPTLHRLGIQAFEPVLVEGKAIKLHPLVCTAYNADFDGDQMAVHLPLGVEAQAECRFIMLSPNNLLKPSDGGPVAVPSQDMVLGIYYLTQEREGVKGEGGYYKSVNEAYLAYENGALDLHARINVRMTKEVNGKPVTGFVNSTFGRFIFNEIIQQDLGFVDRSKPENTLSLEIDQLVGKKQLKKILEKVIEVHGALATAETLDRIKAMGYKYSTRAAMTVSISDMTVPSIKADLIRETEAKVDRIQANYDRGLVTEEERYNEVISTWNKADNELTEALLGGLDKYNNIFMMADSGARGSDKQIKQLAGMRGLMSSTTGRTIELPIKSNFREGLDVLEYFISAHGARKGLSDTALRTADSGYLTRRLVDVSQDLIIHDDDCSAEGEEIPCIEIGEIKNGNEVIVSLRDRLVGRTLAEDIKDGRKFIARKNEIITAGLADAIVATIEKNGQEKVKIRSILSCRSHVGICSKCYGTNLATAAPVQVGEAVGIMAAQSIGEPGTQLTMRTFHTGGVAGDDITQGLPRVEEIFEARRPKGCAIITAEAGQVTIREEKGTSVVYIVNPETYIDPANLAKSSKSLEKPEDFLASYKITYGSRMKVQEGDIVEKGDSITEGSIYPQDILEIKGVRAVQEYMTSEVQKVYRIQGVEINDKHIEVIVRQMLKKTVVTESNDSNIIEGTRMNTLDFEEMNARLIAEGKTPAEGKPVLLGITPAALATDSFLSAASFQETTRVLTEAAVQGKVDPLVGLKENVIIGKLIPAGTGMKRYRSVVLDTDGSDLYDIKGKIAVEQAEEESETPEADEAVAEIEAEAEAVAEVETEAEAEAEE